MASRRWTRGDGRWCSTGDEVEDAAASSDGRERVGTLRRELEHVKTTMTSLLTNAALEAALVKILNSTPVRLWAAP